MAFKKASFITSAPSLDDCPPATLPEVCFAGRSNVGKSSMINALVNKKRLARTSNQPGKTQQMNYYQVDDSFYLVDLPGYGFAKVPKKERERWGRDIRQYLLNRSSLVLIVHVVDIRHEPSKLDEEFFYWLGVNRMPFCVALSKSDKLSNNKQKKSESRLHRILSDMNIEVPVISFSTSDGAGVKPLRALIQEFLEPQNRDELPIH